MKHKLNLIESAESPGPSYVELSDENIKVLEEILNGLNQISELVNQQYTELRLRNVRYE